MPKGLTAWIASILFLVGTAGAAYAQSPTGSISGAITDSTGAVIPGATVTITNTATGAIRSLMSNGAGLYSAPALDAGEYQVQCEQKGFQTTERAAEVEAGSATTVNFSLAPGTVSQEVKVSAAATAQMNYESHSVAGVIPEQTIQSLPLNGRSFVQLASLQPGVQVVTQQQGVRNAPIGISVLGGGGQYPLVTVDGLQINDFLDGNAGAGTAINFSNEVIREFQLSSANFDLSTPTTMQGAVNMVTRSGTNNLHGSAYMFYRDHNMAAYPGLRFNPKNPNPYFVRKNPGFTLGGPILKNKLFFFGNYEYTGQTTAVAVQPDLASIAPAAAIFSSPIRYNYTTVRLDYNPSQRLTTFLRWTQDRNSGLGLGSSSPAFPSNWVSLYNWSEQYALGITDVMTPNLVADFRLGFRDWHNIEAAPTEAQCPSCLGGILPGVADTGLPQLSMIGSANWATGNNAQAVQNRLARDLEPQYTLSWQKGVHSLKFGFDLDYVNIVWTDPVCANGCVSVESVENTRSILGAKTATYAPNLPTTITTSADLLNLPLFYPTGSFQNGFSAGPPQIPGPYEFDKERKEFRFRWFAQDSWKMRHNLTVNYGLGYALETRLFPSDMPIPGLYGPVYGLAPGTTQPPTPTNRLEFSPAFGFVYSPGSSGKTVIRGGAGVYWDTSNYSAKSHSLAIYGPVGNGPLNLPSTVFTNTFPNIVQQGPGGTLIPLPIGAQIPANIFTSLTLGQFMQIHNQQYPAINAKFMPATPTRSGPYQYSNMDLVKQSSATLNAHYPLPRSYQTSIGIQRELPSNIVLTADWVQRDVQQNSIGSLDLNHYSQYINGVQSPIVPKCTNAQLFVLGQQCSTGAFSTYTNGGRALYEGLLVTANKRLSNNYQFALSYAFQNLNSKTIVNLNDYTQGYGPTIAHHNLNISGLANLPLHFELSVNSSFITRNPVEIMTTSIDIAGSGAQTTGPLPGLPVRGWPSPSQLKNAVSNFNATYAGTHAPNGATIPTYVLPPSYNLGRPQISQDFRLTKTFTMHDRYSLALYGEVFNAFNIANLTGYSTNLDIKKATNQTYAFGQATGRAGQIFLSAGPRAEQIGARFSF